MQIFTLLLLSLVLALSANASPDVDAYRVLGVDANASQSEIARAWRDLTKQHMPLVNQGNASAEEKMKEINRAWNLLKTPAKRAAYDASSENTGSGDQTGERETFKHTNVDEVLKQHPEWASILSNYDLGVAELIVKKDWTTFLHIYEAMVDEQFVLACFRGLAKQSDSVALRDVLKQIIQIEKFSHPPHPRVWNLGKMVRFIFSQDRFAALTAALLPKLFATGHLYDLRLLMRDVFAKTHSLPLGDRYLWEIVRRTRNEDDKGTLYMMAEWVFRDGETGSHRDPELLVALVQEEGNQIMASRVLAWRYRPEWGGRGMQAIIDKADIDALKGLRTRLASKEFTGSQWDVYREVLKGDDKTAGPALEQKKGKLILNEPEPFPVDCETLISEATWSM